MGKRILVVGGVAGGAGAAVKARRTSEDAEIVVFERTPYVSWANCGLPYYMGGVIQRREELFVVSPRRLAARFNVDVRTRHEVTAIDRSRKAVSVRNLDTRDTSDERRCCAPLSQTATSPAPATLSCARAENSLR